MSSISHWVRTPNGDFQRSESLPISDRGFRYGMAIFETIGVRDGRAILLDEHLKSGLSACLASGFQVDGEWFRQAGSFLLTILKPESIGVARLHVTAGDGTPTDPAAHCRMIVSFEERQAIPAAVYERGYRLVSGVRPFSPTINGRKTHNYWPNVNELQSAKAAGADEILIFSPTGNLVSASMANVFVVISDGTIKTPPAGYGARAGVVRGWVMQQCNVQERDVERSELQQVQEVFLTNSWLGIMPTATIDGTVLPDNSVSKSLLQKYHCI